MLNAIILAGDQPIKDSDNTQNKATLMINGKMMVEYVIDALRCADSVDRIVVVGPTDVLGDSLNGKVETVVGQTDSIMGNLMAGVRYLADNRFVLVCTCDIPMVTTEAINDFIAKSRELNADLSYPIVEKSVNEKKFPGAARTYVKLKEGSFTGGNAFYINPSMLESGAALADKLIGARKNPFKMASLLSVNFLVKLLAGTLSIESIEDKVSGMLGINARAIISEYAEIGNDVDKSSDVEAATAYLSR